MVVVGVGAVCATIGMSYAMSQATILEIDRMIERVGKPVFLGQTLNSTDLHFLLSVVHFIGWSICFFLIYAVVTNLRQLISNVKYYVKHQTLTVRFLRWIKRECVKLYNYVVTIDIHEKLDKSIVKIVVANFVILTILCCMWFFGVAGLIIYSIALFVIIRKQCQKIQTQYHSILQATEKMADGDLKISLEEDLGMFAPIGESLERVQQGFEKAVIEEAKSQNM